MKPVDITNLIKKYGPGYIAKDKKSGRVVAHASRVDVLMKKVQKARLATKQANKEVVVSWLPKKQGRYVFNISLLLRGN